MKKRFVCYKCGLEESNDIHGKAYGGGRWDMDGELHTQPPTHAPHQHPYEPGVLRPMHSLGEGFPTRPT